MAITLTLKMPMFTNKRETPLQHSSLVSSNPAYFPQTPAAMGCEPLSELHLGVTIYLACLERIQGDNDQGVIRKYMPVTHLEVWAHAFKQIQPLLFRSLLCIMHRH